MLLMDRLIGSFSKDVAIDLGTANTIVAIKGEGIVINEPSVVAVQSDKNGYGEIIAIGREAKDMEGKTPHKIEIIRPMKDGIIADFEMTERMIRFFIEKAYKRNVTQMGLSFVCFTVLSLVLIPFSPIGMMNIYIVFAITLFINGVFAVFMVTPLASVFEKKFKNTKLKERRAKKLMAKREKLAKQNRNKGAEPEEIIIPGIND